MRPSDASVPQSETMWSLSERLKELTALHATARIIQDDQQTPQELLRRVLHILPPAWQYPEITQARLVFSTLDLRSQGWEESPWVMSTSFRVSTGEEGRVEVAYTEARPEEAEGPFLAEERALIDSIAEMLHRWFQHRAADEALEEIRKSLERIVTERTADLSRINAALRHEVEEHRAAQAAIERYQGELRDMAASLCLAGERERRNIAQALHDHVGQSLAFARMRLLDIRGNAVFCGFEEDLAHVLRLLDGTLRYTRDLTCELSPPRLYELGLDAALDWLVEHYRAQHKVNLLYRGTESLKELDEEARAILYASARELLSNAIRHGRPANAWVTLMVQGDTVRLQVRDDGASLQAEQEPVDTGTARSRFGLFSIRERLRSRRGRLHVTSSPGAGTTATVEIPRKKVPLP